MAQPLPFIDEHARAVTVPAAVAWRAVRDVMGGPSGAAAGSYARLVGARDGRAFTVARREPPRLLELVGEHRFARYSLVFIVDGIDPDHCSVRAQTRAEFPGWAGRLYRLLVIDSRAHVLAVRRMLARIARRAERPV